MSIIRSFVILEAEWLLLRKNVYSTRITSYDSFKRSEIKLKQVTLAFSTFSSICKILTFRNEI